MKQHWLVISAVVMLVIAVALAASPPSVDVTITDGTSIPGGAVPAPPGMGQGQSGNPNQWFYYYNIAEGSSLVDTLPIQICTNSTPNSQGETGYPLTLSYTQGQGGNLPGVTKNTIPTFNNNNCQTVNIDINTGVLSAGNYTKNIEIQKGTATPANTQVNLKGKGIHIHVHVQGASNRLSCFVTSSEFNYLQDCNGNLVTSGFDGRFTIVPNARNIESATNPGQFYYNALWVNTTGNAQSVTVNFTRVGVNPQGTNAIHALVFPSTPPLSAASFNAVNSGIPGGNKDVLTGVLVPAGHTLWTDYHLAWSDLGKPVPLGIAQSCGLANQPFSVTATVTFSGGPDTCNAGASGYLKK